jgi:hypothetical protein
VETPGYVAGRPVYELVLTPKSPASTIGTATVSVDAATGAPLDAKITARGAASPAIELRFTSISFNKPAASVFAFTPPPGATVTQASSPSALTGLGARPFERGRERHGTPPTGEPAKNAPSTGPMETTTIVGTDWTTVAVISGAPLGELRSIFSNAQAVNSPAGPGHLITTPLINVLVLQDGRVAVGAVTPAALQAAIPPS